LVPTTGSCTITVTFKPTAAGTRLGAVTIDNDSGAAKHVDTVSLDGKGTAPISSLDFPTLSFGSQLVGTTSATVKSFTITNIGDADLHITAIDVGGDYAPSSLTPCGPLPATLVPTTGSCTITVTFKPTAAGTRLGEVAITDDSGAAAAHVDTVGLVGTGTGTAPAVTLLPDLLTFSPQGVGTTSAPQTVTLTNSGAAALTIPVSGIAISGDFTQTNTCPVAPATLGAGLSCAFTVKFAPTTTDIRRGGITITDNLGNPHVISLSGTGVTSFALSTAAGTTTLPRGVDSATYTISATSAFGFTGDIALSCTGTESGVCTFSPASIKPGQSSTLTLSGVTGFTSSFLVFTAQGLSGFQTASQALTLLISDYAVAPTPASATITAGQPATYNLTLSPVNGFSGSVSLACSGNPVRSTCAISPTSVPLAGVNPGTATVTVNTTARAVAPPSPGIRLAPPGLGIFDGLRQQMLWLLALLMLGGILAAGNASARRARLNTLVLAAVLIMGLLWAACGGETANVPQGDVGTPAGTYFVTITSTSGSAVHTTSLTLKVN
jgi:hypothetical protein